MNRRTFLTLSITGIAGSLSYVLYPPLFENHAVTFIKTLLKNKLIYLNLDNGGLNKYSVAFLKNKSLMLKIKISLAGIVLKWSNSIDLVEKTIGKDRINKLNHEITLNYLLSTDFFINNSNETLIVKYIAFYNPENAACRHPFARFS